MGKPTMKSAKREPTTAWKLLRQGYMDAMYEADERPIPDGYEERSARAEAYANKHTAPLQETPTT